MSDELTPIDTTANLPDIKLDLDEDKTLRVTSLMLAIRYHEGTIVRDAAMYQQLKMSNVELKPTQAKLVVVQAMMFEDYLRGNFSGLIDEAMADFLVKEMGGDDEPGGKSGSGSQAPTP